MNSVETFNKKISDFKKDLFDKGFNEVVLKQYGTDLECDATVYMDNNRRLYCLNTNGERVYIKLKNFMCFEVYFEAAGNGLYECLRAEITDTGDHQFKFLESHVQALSNICKTTQTIYAPFTSFIQSSGFGKTKLCLELLKKHPGIYFVFRRESDTGVPHMENYMKDFVIFVVGAQKDELPLELT